MTPMRFTDKNPGDQVVMTDGARYVVDDDGTWVLDCGTPLPMAVSRQK